MIAAPEQDYFTRQTLEYLEGHKMCGDKTPASRRVLEAIARRRGMTHSEKARFIEEAASIPLTRREAGHILRRTVKDGGFKYRFIGGRTEA